MAGNQGGDKLSGWLACFAITQALVVQLPAFMSVTSAYIMQQHEEQW